MPDHQNFMAWETTPDDVENVLVAHGNDAAPADIIDMLGPYDFGRIEKAALWFFDIEEQTDAAMAELEDILMEKGVLGGDKRFRVS